MNTQTPVVLRLLPLALACGLLALAAPALAAKPNPKEPAGCLILNVFLNGPSVKVGQVTCDKGAYDGDKPTPDGVVLTFHQSDARGPKCTITVAGGKGTAVLSVQQNPCILKAGAITASVVSGNARLTRTVRGGFPTIAGEVYFSIGF
jgi:hypothetical protein